MVGNSALTRAFMDNTNAFVPTLAATGAENLARITIPATHYGESRWMTKHQDEASITEACVTSSSTEYVIGSEARDAATNVAKNSLTARASNNHTLAKKTSLKLCQGATRFVMFCLVVCPMQCIRSLYASKR